MVRDCHLQLVIYGNHQTFFFACYYKSVPIHIKQVLFTQKIVSSFYEELLKAVINAQSNDCKSHSQLHVCFSLKSLLTEQSNVR